MNNYVLMKIYFLMQVPTKIDAAYKLNFIPILIAQLVDDSQVVQLGTTDSPWILLMKIQVDTMNIKEYVLDIACHILNNIQVQTDTGIVLISTSSSRPNPQILAEPHDT